MMLTRSTYRAADLELRGDGRPVVGLAVPFEQPTEIRTGPGAPFTEMFKRGAFARTLAERGASKIKLLASHNAQALPLGRLTVAREDRAGLYIEGRVSATQAGDEVLALIADGALDSFSVGFNVAEKGDRWVGNVREIIEARLAEVSIVAWPAYEGAAISGLRSADKYNPRLDPELLIRQLTLL